MTRFRFVRLVAACAALFGAACESATAPLPERPDRVEWIESPAAVAAGGRASLAVRTSVLGVPLEGLEVRFEVSGPAGTVARTVVTDAEGVARATLDWPTAVGGVETAVHVEGGPTLRRLVQVEAGPPAWVRIEGAAQGPLAVAATRTLSLAVADAYGNARAWTVLDIEVEGECRATGSAATGEDGRATLLVEGRGRLLEGRCRVTARAATVVARATFSVVPGAPVALVAGGGQGQRAAVGERISEPLVARVLDRDGNPVPGVPVRFVPVSGGAQPLSGSVLTDAAGEARTGASAGYEVGAQALDAWVVGLDPLRFEIWGLAPPE